MINVPDRSLGRRTSRYDRCPPTTCCFICRLGCFIEGPHAKLLLIDGNLPLNCYLGC